MNERETQEAEAQAVIQAEKRLAQAHLELDLQVIEQLLHPDYVIVQPGGQVQSKAQVLASYRTGRRHWHSAESDRMDVRIYPDSAIVIGRWRAAGVHGDETFDYAARFLSVWVKTEQGWRNVAYQSTQLEV